MTLYQIGHGKFKYTTTKQQLTRAVQQAKLQIHCSTVFRNLNKCGKCNKKLFILFHIMTLY